MSEDVAWLRQLVTGHWNAAAVNAFLQLDLADRLAVDGPPRESETLAREVGAHAPSVLRLLRGLAALEVVREATPGAFVLTSVGAMLRRDHPAAVRDYALFEASPAQWASWGRLTDAVRDGAPAFDRANGRSFYEQCALDSDLGVPFHASMASLSARVGAAVAEAYDFSSVRTIVDVGGGHGSFLLQLLARHAHLEGILFDRGDVTAAATDAIAAVGLSDRCQAVGGDFFIEVPRGDVITAKNILHNWSDEHVVQILRVMGAATAEKGRILIVEQLLPEPGKTSDLHRVDLEMLHATHGRERRRDELEALFAQAGLCLTRTIATSRAHSILEGTRVVRG